MTAFKPMLRCCKWLTFGALLALSTALLLTWAPKARDDPAQVFRRALAALERNDKEAAVRSIRILSRHPDYQPHSELLRAWRLFHEGKPQLALGVLSQLQPPKGLEVPTLRLTGECLHALDDLRNAESVYRALSQLESGRAEPHLRLAAIRHAVGDVNGAVREIDEAVRREPENFLGYRMMGAIYSHYEMDAEAIDFFNQALRRAPPPDQRSAIARELAQCLIRQHRHEQALAVLRDAESSDVRTLSLRAECLMSLGRFEAARDIILKARDVEPENSLLLLLTARVMLYDGRPAEAIKPLQTLLAHEPHNSQAHYQLALVHARLGDDEAYRAQMEKKEAAEAMRLKLSDLYDEARRKPHDAEVRHRIAELCDELGQRYEAEGWRRAAAACNQLAQTSRAEAVP